MLARGIDPDEEDEIPEESEAVVKPVAPKDKAAKS